MKKLITFTLLICLMSIKSWSQTIEGIWLNDVSDAKIEVYKANNGKYYGKIVWLKEPSRDGKPKVDKFNSKKSLQTRPIMGLVILSGLEKKGGSYENGTIYDPKSGKTYSCTVKPNGNNQLDIRGFMGISLIGKTTTWTLSK